MDIRMAIILDLSIVQFLKTKFWEIQSVSVVGHKVLYTVGRGGE